MSKRHLSSKVSVPGAGAHHHPSHWDREEEHRRVRRNVRQTLSSLNVDTLEDVVLERPHGTGDDYRWSEDEAVPREPPKRVRVWKLPFWKRRNLVRKQRALEEQRLIKEGSDALEAILVEDN